MSYLRTIQPAILVLLLLAAALLLAAFTLTSRTGMMTGRANAPQIPPPRQEFAPPESEEPAGAATPQEILGVVVPRESIDVGADVEGRLESVFVNPGDRVKPGDRIARINADSIRGQLTIAQALLDAARAQAHRARLAMDEAEGRFQRRQALAAEGLLSKEEVISTELQVKMASSSLAEAGARLSEQQARIDQLNASLAFAELRSPVAGTVAARHLNPGARVQLGSPVVTLMQEDQLWIRIALPSDRIAELKPGSILSAKFESPGNEGPATLAVVERISPAVDAVSQQFLAEARLNLPPAIRGLVKSGMTARCRLKE
jgi:RND family efflux transporter MFP subunit